MLFEFCWAGARLGKAPTPNHYISFGYNPYNDALASDVWYYNGVFTVRIKEGSKAPAFALPDARGMMHSLDDYAGKRLVLYFYPKDSTPGCTMEAKGFSKHISKIKRLCADVVGISKDEGKSHAKFIKSCGLKITLLSDPESNTIKAYGAYGDRCIIGMGTLRKTFIIDEKGKIIKIYEKVNPAGHAEEVVEFLRSAA